MEGRQQPHRPAPEPQRAHTDRVCNPPHSGAEPEQTLLINEGKQGSRSIATYYSASFSRVSFRSARFYDLANFHAATFSDAATFVSFNILGDSQFSPGSVLCRRLF